MDQTKGFLAKISVDDLKIGMFVAHIDQPWITHPFITSKKRITSEKQIQKLKEYGIDHVYIDPAMGMIDPGSSLDGEETADFSDGSIQGQPKDPLVLSIPESIDEKLFSPTLPPRRPYQDPVSFPAEIEAARLVQKEAHSVIRQVMRDARMGRNVESAGVKRVVNRMIDSIFRNRDALLSLTRIRGYDEYTFVHSINVCILCLTLGRHIDFSRELLEHFGIGSLLHDVGKMRVSRQILNKPGKITDEERKEINKHPLFGLEILDASRDIPDNSKQVVLQHHERSSGQGYPHGLREAEIHVLSQIAAIIDVYDAMTTDRVYKKASPPHVALKEIYRSIRSDFNQGLVERFIQCVGIYPVGSLVLLDTKEIGIVTNLNPERLLRPNVLILFRTPQVRYPKPVLADLMEISPETGGFRRTIETALDPGQYGIQVEDFLSGTSRGPGHLLSRAG